MTRRNPVKENMQSSTRKKFQNTLLATKKRKHTVELVKRILLIDCIVWIIDDVIQNSPRGIWIRIHQSLRRDAECKHEDEEQEQEEQQICDLNKRTTTV